MELEETTVYIPELVSIDVVNPESVQVNYPGDLVRLNQLQFSTLVVLLTCIVLSINLLAVFLMTRKETRHDRGAS